MDSLASRRAITQPVTRLPTREMSFVLASTDLVIAIHGQILERGEWQGLAGDKSLDSAISRVQNRLA